MISVNPQPAWEMKQLGALSEGSKSALFGLERPNLRTRCLFPKAMRAPGLNMKPSASAESK